MDLKRNWKKVISGKKGLATAVYVLIVALIIFFILLIITKRILDTGLG